MQVIIYPSTWPSTTTGELLPLLDSGSPQAPSPEMTKREKAIEVLALTMYP